LPRLQLGGRSIFVDVIEKVNPGRGIVGSRENIEKRGKATSKTKIKKLIKKARNGSRQTETIYIDIKMKIKVQTRATTLSNARRKERKGLREGEEGKFTAFNCHRRVMDWTRP